MFLAGLSWRLHSQDIALAGAAMPALWLVMHDYQRKRILTLLNPESDLRSAPVGHIIQSNCYRFGWRLARAYLHAGPTSTRLNDT
ncbi:MAG: hypothetical protein R3F24_03480 [Gammaproteobacteria bacterium]